MKQYDKKFKLMSIELCKGNALESELEKMVSKNLLDRGSRICMPSKAWVSDITYIPTGFGWLYLTTVMELFDRKVVGAMGNSLKSNKTTIPSLNITVKNKKGKKDLIFHSDRGVQYACGDFR